MSYSLQQLIIPISPFQSTRGTSQSRVAQFRVLCCSAKSNLPQGKGKRAESEPRVILVERYSDGAAKRYIQGEGLFFQTVIDEHVSSNNNLPDSHVSGSSLSWLPSVVKEFFLPAGFPGSVSEDYVLYMLLQFPTNVTAWICHTLVTSSLLKAVGVSSFSGTSAAASAAAIRWVSKDGIGAVGRLFIGGRFGNLFDDDPKQWRMYADFIGSAGSIFDISTQVYPAYFLQLASIGNLAKAVARGLKDPSFRVIQNHFAISGNLGEVAAKEEVWEVAAQLLGLALGVLILDSAVVKHYPTLASTWAGIRLVHLWLRYQSLSVLQFNSINLKRARMLVWSHVLTSTVPGCVDCNREENILLWQRFMKPRITFGVPLDKMIGGERSVSKLKMLLRIFQKEKYILLVKHSQEVEVFVSFKVGATGVTVLRSLWQTYWLHKNLNMPDDILNEVEQSLLDMNDKFEGFFQQLSEAGWDTSQINLRVPKGVSIDEHPT